MKRRIAALLTFCLAFGWLTSCHPQTDHPRNESNTSVSTESNNDPSTNPNPITLFGGQDYDIVYDAEGIEPEIQAAKELQTYLQKMTGRIFPLRDDNLPSTDFEIIVGQTNRENSVFSLDRTQLQKEEIRIFAAEQRLVVLGEGTRGTLYAVYELLEQLGCRFYATNVETIPSLDRITLPGHFSLSQTPAFEYRDIFQTCTYDNATAVKLRLNGGLLVGGTVGRQLRPEWGGGITYAGPAFVHTFDWFVPLETYKENHPEYFSMINGQRNLNAHYTQLCLTNEEVYQIVLAGVRKWLEENPQSKIISVSSNDGLVIKTYCTCPDCDAINSEEQSPMGTLLRFVNRIAADIQSDYPDVYVDTLAYQYSITPCQITKPAENVIIRYCTGICCAHSVSSRSACNNQKAAANIRRWIADGAKLYVWDYTVNFANYLTPYPNIHAVAGSIQYYAKHNVSGVFMQGMYQDGESGEFGELRAYVMAKLLWDPNCNVDTLIEDFMNAYYGNAAQPIKTYLETLRRALNQSNKCWYLVDPVELYQDVLTMDDVKMLDTLWTEAKKAASDTEAYTRVLRSEIEWRYYKYLAQYSEFSDASSRQAEYQRLLDDCQKLGVTRLNEGALLPTE